MSFVSPRKKKHSRDSPSFPKSKPRTPGRWTLQVLRNFVDRKLKKNFSPRKQKSSLVSLLCCYSPSLRSLVGKWRQQSRSVPGGASRGCHQWSWEFPHLPAKHTTECSRLFKTIQERSSFPMDFFQIVSVWPCFYLVNWSLSAISYNTLTSFLFWEFSEFPLAAEYLRRWCELHKERSIYWWISVGD